jgi:hypothetical protein
MVTSVKGIQYSYKIDFHNQVATSLKSQVHDLPVLSAPEATPVDINKSDGQIVPDFENRKIFAGTKAAPVPTPESGVEAGPDPDAAFDENVPANSSTEPLTNREVQPGKRALKNPARENTDQTIDNLPGFEVNPSLRSIELANDVPKSDSQPLEPVKAMPKANYNRAMRAYKPDYGSFLQTTGYEPPMQAGAVQSNLQSQAPVGNLAPMSSISPNGTNNAAKFFAPVNEENIAEPLEAEYQTLNEKENTDKNIEKPENFIVRQARRIYEIISDSALVSSGNKIDVYF